MGERASSSYRDRHEHHRSVPVGPADRRAPGPGRAARAGGSSPPTRRRPSFWRAPFAADTWKRTAFALGHFPVSIVAFTVVLTGLCLALGLAVTLLGLPVLLVTFAAARLGARIDRRFGRATLGTGAGEPDRRLPSGPGPWRRFVARLLDPWSWRESGYHLAAFPLSTVAFTLTLSLWSAAVGGITFYAWWWAQTSLCLTGSRPTPHAAPMAFQERREPKVTGR